MKPADIIEKFVRWRATVPEEEKHDSYWCTQNGVTIDELREAKRVVPGWTQLLLEAKRAKYPERMHEIDDALMKKALSGDTKAAELVYKRFDGWNPKDPGGAGGQITTFAELMRRAYESAEGSGEAVSE